jgi:hypothetical protein
MTACLCLVFLYSFQQQVYVIPTAVCGQLSCFQLSACVPGLGAEESERIGQLGLPLLISGGWTVDTLTYLSESKTPTIAHLLSLPLCLHLPEITVSSPTGST